MRTVIRNNRTQEVEFTGVNSIDDAATTALQVLFVLATFLTIALTSAALQSISL